MDDIPYSGNISLEKTFLECLLELPSFQTIILITHIIIMHDNIAQVVPTIRPT